MPISTGGHVRLPALRDRANPGDRAVLYFLRVSITFAFYGCLYAGVIAVPTYMAHAEPFFLSNLHRDSRFGGGCRSDNICVLEDLPENLAGSVRARSGWISIEETQAFSPENYSTPDIGSDSIAFLAVHVRIDRDFLPA